MSKWTGRDIPSQAGRLAVITGANSGIGYPTAIELARAGMRVVLACRSTDKGEAALQRIRSELPGANIELMHLDLADLASIKQFSQEFLKKYQTLDLLVNNAGIMAIPKRLETRDNFEMQLGTNHLGHFALTGLLISAILRSTNARVVTVSSTAHKRGQIQFSDLQLEKSYSPWGAYCQSKLANLLFAFELQRRLAASNPNVLSIAAHPGWSATNLFRTGNELGGSSFLGSVSNYLAGHLAQPDWQGALPTLYAATMPDVSGGAYYGPDGFMEVSGYPTLVKPKEIASSKELAAKLWTASEQLTGITFDASPPAC